MPQVTWSADRQEVLEYLRMYMYNPEEVGSWFSGIDIHGEDLTDWRLPGIVLDHSYLSDCVFRSVIMNGASLRGCDLRGADLRTAKLMGANLRRSDLRGAKLRWARLDGADLRDCKL